MADPTPLEIKLRTRSRLLEVAFDDGARYELPFEYLRVIRRPPRSRDTARARKFWCWARRMSGSAVEPVGQYAVKLVFDDGHDTGLFTWKYLHELGRDQAANWAKYLKRKGRLSRPSAGGRRMARLRQRTAGQHDRRDLAPISATARCRGARRPGACAAYSTPSPATTT